MPNTLMLFTETSGRALRGGVISGLTCAALVGLSVTPVSSHGTSASRYPSAQDVRSCGRRCGVERWQIKTLSDPEADRVDRTPVPTTVEALGALPRPARTPQLSRVSPV